MNNKKEFEIKLNILLINCEGKPAIQLRKTISQQTKMRALIERALKDGEIPAKIIFKDPYMAAIKLKALGLL